VFDDKHTERKAFIWNWYLVLKQQHAGDSIRGATVPSLDLVVLRELPNLWKLLEEKELTPPSTTYSAFYLQAMQIRMFEFMKAQNPHIQK